MRLPAGVGGEHGFHLDAAKVAFKHVLHGGTPGDVVGLLAVGGVGLAVGVHLVEVELVGVVGAAQDVEAEAVFLVADAALAVAQAGGLENSSA